MGADLGPEVQLADRRDPVSDAALLEVPVKAVDVPGAEVTEPDVPDGLFDTNQVLRVGSDGLGLQVELGILGHVLIREVGEANGGVRHGPVFHLFLEQNGLPLQLLFDLPVGHVRLRYPGHVLSDALAGVVVAQGDGDFVPPPLFLDGRHRVLSLLSCLHPCAWYDILNGAKGPFVAGWSLHLCLPRCSSTGEGFFFVFREIRQRWRI